MRTVAEFQSRFGAEPKLFRAPARVNIIGEHTDYNDGYVLPTTTALYTCLGISKRPDRMLRVYSGQFDSEIYIDLDQIERDGNEHWCEYVKGVLSILQSEGHQLCGADMLINSEIPLGGGLSSSASLETVVALAVLDCAGVDIDRTDLARICYRAESEFVGVRCGIMDQYAVSCNERGHAMMLDCRTETAESIPLPENTDLLLVHSGVQHKLEDGDYNFRRAECEKAVRLLAGRIPGLASLRDLSLAKLEENKEALDDRLFSRCRHVVTEIARVEKAAPALRDSNPVRLGSLLSESHVSLRDDYEVSCSELNALVDIAMACEGVYGSRMMGAGFGGCTVTIVASAQTDDAVNIISSEYAVLSGKRPWTHVVKPATSVESIGS